MPRRPYVRRTAVKAVPEEPNIAAELTDDKTAESCCSTFPDNTQRFQGFDLPTTEFPEQEAAPEAASVVSDPPSCAMSERKWRGYPVWQCPKCRVDTLDPGLAQVARRACRK